MAVGRYRTKGGFKMPGTYPDVIGAHYFVYTWLNPPVSVKQNDVVGPAWPDLHPSWGSVQDITHPGPPYKEGGPFYLISTECSPILTGDMNLRKGMAEYRGKFYIAPQASDATPMWDYPSTQDLSTYGPTGWRKFKPGKPTAELSVFLAELRDFKSLLKDTVSRLDSIRSAGSKWLSYQFGWAPMLRDLQKFYDTWRNASKKLDRLRKYNGRYERRGGTVAANSETYASSTACYFGPTLSSVFYPGYQPTPSYPVVHREYRVWFEAAYKYWIPGIGTPAWEANATRQLYGLSLTPSVVWELVPWSWLIDWFTNLGDVISNLDDGLAENLTTAYAFVMRQQLVSADLSAQQVFLVDGGQTTLAHSVTQRWVIKERATASPFSVGMTTDDLLSARQWSILGALGAQRFKIN